MSDSLYGMLFVSDEGADQAEASNVSVLSDLTGKKFHSISSHSQGIIASCADGYHMVSGSNITSVPGMDFLQGSGGDDFFIAIDSKTNHIYSWGLGDNGQLGQGACKTCISEPMQIKYNATFKSIACGDSFTIAVDEQNTAYGWGEVNVTSSVTSFMIFTRSHTNQTEL